MAKSRIRRFWSKGMLAAATVTTAGAGFTGFASAASISNTGAGSYNEISEGYDHVAYGHGNDQGYYQHNDWSGQNYDWAYDWDSHGPQYAMGHGQNFDQWYDECLSWLGSHAPQYNTGHHNDHSYGGNDWSSWNPQHYQDNGHGSYEDWYGQMMQYMDSHYNQWQNSWSNSHSGAQGSDDQWQDDQNDWNQDQGHGSDNNWGGYTSESYDSDQETNVENINDVSVSNNNPQTAESGDVRSVANTVGGEAYSGDAVNESENSVVVSVSNETDVPSTGNDTSDFGGYANIGNTGYGSYNAVRYSSYDRTNVTNLNNVSVWNSNSQYARSGDVTSAFNTWGGNVRSGDAVNYSSNSIVVTATNR